MPKMFDCLVSYYSVNAHRDGMPLQYLCYRVLSGPGPIAAGGVAVITLLGAKNPADGNLYHSLHAVQVGGPRAALAAALKYLDIVHRKDDLARVRSKIRCMPCLEPRAGASDFSQELSTLTSPDAERDVPTDDRITVRPSSPSRRRRNRH
jgi:hypothetical protein